MSEPQPIQEVLAFLDYLRFEKRYALPTIESYSSDLNFLFLFLKEQYETEGLSDIQAPMIRGWLASMKEQGHSAKSINRRISAVKSFYRFLLRKGWVKTNPAALLVAPKISKRLPVYVEKKDMETLFSYVTFPDDWKGRVEKMVFMLFYATGMRLSELTNLKDEQVDMSRRQLKILGKGNKERFIPMEDELCRALTEYKQERTTFLPQVESVFFLVQENGKPLHPRYVQNLIKKYLELVTTIEKKSPHVLRHSFATHLMNNGADLNAVKALLGHSSLAATQVYTHNTIEKLKDIHAKAHPKS
ncbi:MAG: tyrosine-type recombinase/integrase [Bacteroidetes bacterium]|nr:tyrosine-type recombinase/integrase [Bacteroidota bacterium]